MEEKRITILLGAGAMTDVTGITTNSLTKLISDNALIKKIVGDLEDFFQQNYNGVITKENVNFEDIMHALEILYNFKFCKSEFVKKFKPIYCMFGKLIDKYKDTTCQEIEKAQDEINEKIKKEIFSFENKYNDDLNSWFINFFKSLKKLNEDDIYLDIFSLNYDNWLENILNIKNLGFLGSNEEFNLNEIFNTCKQNTICHPHGHISLSRDHGYSRQSQTGEMVKRDIIISGLNKLEKTISIPFSAYRTLLHGCLIKNSSLLIIGYGFNDLYINSLLEDFTNTHNKKRKLVILNYRKIDYINNYSWNYSQEHGIPQNEFTLIPKLFMDTSLNSKYYSEPIMRSEDKCCIYYFDKFKDTIIKHSNNIINFLIKQ